METASVWWWRCETYPVSASRRTSLASPGLPQRPLIPRSRDIEQVIGSLLVVTILTNITIMIIVIFHHHCHLHHHHKGAQLHQGEHHDALLWFAYILSLLLLVWWPSFSWIFNIHHVFNSLVKYFTPNSKMNQICLSAYIPLTYVFLLWQFFWCTSCLLGFKDIFEKIG